MQDKKQTNEDQNAVEKRVDAMMDPKKAHAEPTTAPELAAAASEAPAAPPAGASEAEPVVANDAVAPTPDEFDDNKTDRAVDEIVSSESDQLLEAEDAKTAEPEVVSRPSFSERFKGFFKAWWHNRWARYGSLAAVVLLVAAVVVVPGSRYFLLNAAGVRSSLSLTVLDNTTQLPLKNVVVSDGSITVKTDKTGLAKLSNLRLGQQTIIIHKNAFTTTKKTVTLGWGSNPLGSFALTAVGDQYQFKLTDYVSNAAIAGAEASDGDASAMSDDKGQVVLTLNNPDADSLQVKVTAPNYRQETVTVKVGASQTIPVTLVPSYSDLYVTKQSGKYDVYKADLDGKNRQSVLPGTGLENNQIGLVVNPNGDEAALVSTRDNIHNSDGYMLQALTLINLKTGVPLTIEHSERIQIVDWVGTKLIYVKIRAGASAANPGRYQLMSYDYNASARVELAHANYFNDIVSAKGFIYYASSNNYKGGQSQLIKLDADKNSKQVILNSEVWNMLRSDYDTMSLSTQNGWYSYKIGASQATKLSVAPADTTDNRLFINDSSNKNSLWADQRDGKGVLLLHDIAANKDKVLVSQSGLNYPVRWLSSDLVLYRVVTPAETADYVVNIHGGTPKKVTDVTNANGVSNWYYY